MRCTENIFGNNGLKQKELLEIIQQVLRITKIAVKNYIKNGRI